MYKDAYSADSLMHTLSILIRYNSSQPFDSILLTCILLPCYITDAATCTKDHAQYPRPQKHCPAVLGSISVHVLFKFQSTAARHCLLAKLAYTPAKAMLANRPATNMIG